MMAAIHLRLGEVDDATAHVNHAVNLDKCNPWAHYEASLLLKLSGYFARAKTQMDTAHRLLPDEPSIAVAWQRMQVKDSAGCSMTTATEHTVLSMIPMDDVQSMRMSGADRMALKMIVDRATAEQAQHGSTATPPVQLQDRPFNAMGLRMQIQGKHAMLEVDTGASGITLTRTIAGTLGLKPLAATHMEGVGGEHAASGYWAHVSEITIGDVTFKNCTVEVISDDSRVRVDGLIGADIFREKLVTLDFPAHELQLDPLPLQPGSMATGAMDRYIAPEMQDWKDFYRAGHLIIVPTKIGDTPMKLFMMDSGAEVNAINPTSARLVSKMNVSDRGIKGISGTNNQVYRAKEVTLTFAGLQQTVENIMSFDTNGLSDNAGVEISGFIGFPALRHVVLKLDYRDNLMRVEYRPKTQ
jgi:predicted aspartyl protease